MSTANFNYANRCIAISEEDLNDENYPEREDKCHSEGNRNYASYLLKNQPPECGILQAVMTYAYYEGACIDYLAFPYDGMTDEEIDEAYDREKPIMNAFLDKIRDDHGYQELACVGRFSNGEAIYEVKK